MVIKEASITIKSKIEELDESGLGMGTPEVSESLISGYYYYSDEYVKLTYTERGEGGEVNSEITLRDGAITVLRTGAIESEMRFVCGREHSSVYSVPPYKFDMTVTPRRIRTSFLVSGGELDLYYNMRIGGASKAVRMRIWIQPS